MKKFEKILNSEEIEFFKILVNKEVEITSLIIECIENNIKDIEWNIDNLELKKKKLTEIKNIIEKYVS